MITLKDVSLRRGPKLLYSGVDLRVSSGQRVGVTGRNGCGKTSLFSLFLGKLQVDDGDIDIPSKWMIAHVDQETPAVDTSAIDYVIDGDKELREVEKQLELSEGEELANLYIRLGEVDGYTANARAAKLLNGLGFSESQLIQPVRSFSGGWRMRLNLAQALMCRSDMLLLDEPTNHLDLDAVYWLERWLCKYPGVLLLISHDREFLDAVVTHIAHTEHHTITRYTGNYSAFEEQRAAHLAQQQSAFEKQQKEIEHLHKYIDRFRAKATKARQAQSRIKTLNRMDIIAAAHVDSPFNFGFFDCSRASDPLISLEKVDIGYDNKAVLENLQLQIRPGDRIGLIGPNGAGKSTLIKCLADEIPVLNGEKQTGKGLEIGYFAQHQLEQLDPQASALLHLQRLDKKATEQSLRNFLGGFDFRGDGVTTPVAPFSGGEKSRLVLAMLVWQKPNLLLLDEPTNHLDLEMRHALTMALQGFEGAMVVVSHDRHLLRTCTDNLYFVHDGSSEEYDGDLNDYRQYLLNREHKSPSMDTKPQEKARPNSNNKLQRKETAEQRKNTLPLRKKLANIEKKLNELQQQKEQIETSLADPELYEQENSRELQDLLKQQAALAVELEDKEMDWLRLSDELEAL